MSSDPAPKDVFGIPDTKNAKKHVIYNTKGIEGEVDYSNTLDSNIRANTITIDELLQVVNEIRQKIKSADIDKDNTDENDNLLKRLQNEYKDFNTIHPLVLRWMVQTGDYDERAFKHYATNHVKAHYKTRIDFLNAQAEYLYALFKRNNPRAPIKHFQLYQKNIKKLLKKDDTDFKNANKEADEEIEKTRQKVKNNLKLSILKYIKSMKK